MIYGHEFERGWSTRDLVTGVAMGATLGVVVGILFAPARGVESRRSLGAAALWLRDRLDRLREPVAAARPLAPDAAPPAMLE